MTRSLLFADQRRLRIALGAALIAVACGESAASSRSTSDAAIDNNVDNSSDAGAADVADAADDGFDAECLATGGYRDAAADAGDAGDAADADNGCWYHLPCGLNGTSMVAIGCNLYSADPPDGSLDARAFGCWLKEGEGCEADAFAPGPNGALTIECKDCLGGGGRRPVGLRAATARATSAVGGYFARMAHEEAAAVLAFERMRQELIDHGAPAELVAAAEDARRDEIRHARVMERLARRHGASAPQAHARRHGRRSLEAMARENAVEGCVNETYGALLLAWQARFARDAATREALAAVAHDEARHAALSWSIARWAESRLGAPARARVARARARALSRLRARFADCEPFDRDVGRPTAAQAAALLTALEARLA